MSAQQGRTVAEWIARIIVGGDAKRGCGLMPDHRVPTAGDDIEKGCQQ